MQYESDCWIGIITSKNDIMKNYDAYFTGTRVAFICPKCRSEYTQEQLFLPQLNQYLEVCPKDLDLVTITACVDAKR